MNIKNREWLKVDKKEIDYHLKQYDKLKEYTKYLIDLIKKFEIIKPRDLIVDLGCGGGANCYFFAKKYPKANFYGLDINPNYIKIAKGKALKNQKYKVANITNLKYLPSKIDVIFSLQTLSWLPNLYKAMKVMLYSQASWIVITSLFYEGPVETSIKIKDFSRFMGELNYRESYYNIYSLKRLNEYIEKLNYEIFFYEPFQIDIDLPKPKELGMGTYTEKLLNKKRIQISGPLLMPWYTIILKNKKWRGNETK